jgi:hypothetical protein
MPKKHRPPSQKGLLSNAFWMIVAGNAAFKRCGAVMPFAGHVMCVIPKASEESGWLLETPSTGITKDAAAPTRRL